MGEEKRIRERKSREGGEGEEWRRRRKRGEESKQRESERRINKNLKIIQMPPLSNKDS